MNEQAPPTTSEEEFPRQGRLAAVDYGTARIGIAICDPDRILCSPLEVWNRKNDLADATHFRLLVKEERIAGWIVGLPLHGDGKESESSARCRMFARWLRQTTARPVRLFDERFTTKLAQSRLNHRKLSRESQKKRIDAIAAQVLLEAFVEALLAQPDTIPGISADGGGTSQAEPLD